FENVLGLQLVEVEHLAELGARLFGRLGRTDDLDDLVDIDDRNEHALDEEQALLAAGQAIPRAAGDDLDAVVDVDHQHVAQPQRRRLAIDEGNVVEAERVFQRSQVEEALDHRGGVEAGLDADDEALAVLAVGDVVDVADALKLL